MGDGTMFSHAVRVELITISGHGCRPAIMAQVRWQRVSRVCHPQYARPREFLSAASVQARKNRLNSDGALLRGHQYHEISTMPRGPHLRARTKLPNEI